MTRQEGFLLALKVDHLRYGTESIDTFQRLTACLLLLIHDLTLEGCVTGGLSNRMIYKSCLQLCIESASPTYITILSICSRVVLIILYCI